MPRTTGLSTSSSITPTNTQTTIISSNGSSSPFDTSSGSSDSTPKPISNLSYPHSNIPYTNMPPKPQATAQSNPLPFSSLQQPVTSPMKDRNTLKPNEANVNPLLMLQTAVDFKVEPPKPANSITSLLNPPTDIPQGSVSQFGKGQVTILPSILSNLQGTPTLPGIVSNSPTPVIAPLTNNTNTPPNNKPN